VQAFFSTTVRSTTDTSLVGTRTPCPSASCSARESLAHGFAAPVLLGMMFSRMPRPPRQSFFEGRPRSSASPSPHESSSQALLDPERVDQHLRHRRRQLVVQLAFEMISSPA
jgi:hypothetical protein